MSVAIRKGMPLLPARCGYIISNCFTLHYVGPGHTGIFSEGGRDWFSYHFYDEERDGLPWVEIRRLQWEAGWPKVTNERFNATAYFD